MEMKLQSMRMERVRKFYGFSNGIDVMVIGSSGGLSFGWKDSCDVSIRFF